MEQLEIVVDSGTGNVTTRGTALQPVTVNLIFPDGVDRIVLAMQGSAPMLDAGDVQTIYEELANLDTALEEVRGNVDPIYEAIKNIRDALPDFEKMDKPMFVPPEAVQNQRVQIVLKRMREFGVTIDRAKAEKLLEDFNATYPEYAKWAEQYKMGVDPGAPEGDKSVAVTVKAGQVIKVESHGHLTGTGGYPETQPTMLEQGLQRGHLGCPVCGSHEHDQCGGLC